MDDFREKLNEVLDRFCAELKAGCATKIDFVVEEFGAFTKPQRAEALYWLIREEVEFRGNASRADYAGRFERFLSKDEVNFVLAGVFGESVCKPDATKEPAAPIDSGPVEIGQIFGQWKIVQLLGRGGMGWVYKVKHKELGFEKAMKFMRRDAAPEWQKRFLGEARSMAAVSGHQNFVSIEDQDDHDRLCFIVMELLDGESLDKVIARGPVDPKTAIDYVDILAKAMNFAHGKGLIHRDLKPANIQVTKHRVLKVLDLGLARAYRAVAPSEDCPAVPYRPEFTHGAGTLAYMAPEQLDPRMKIGPACDLYALGGILYELLTGSVPFTSTDEMELMRKIGHEKPRSPRDLNPSIPEWVADVCLELLDKDPEKRPTAVQLSMKLAWPPVSVLSFGSPARTMNRDPNVGARQMMSAIGCIVLGPTLFCLLPWSCITGSSAPLEFGLIYTPVAAAVIIGVVLVWLVAVGAFGVVGYFWRKSAEFAAQEPVPVQGAMNGLRRRAGRAGLFARFLIKNIIKENREALGRLGIAILCVLAVVSFLYLNKNEREIRGFITRTVSWTNIGWCAVGLGALAIFLWLGGMIAWFFDSTTEKSFKSFIAEFGDGGCLAVIGAVLIGAGTYAVLR